jgi:hypothetical protein
MVLNQIKPSRNYSTTSVFILWFCPWFHFHSMAHNVIVGLNQIKPSRNYSTTSVFFLRVTTYHRRTRGGVIIEEMEWKSVSVILNTAHCLDEHLIIVAPHVYLTLLVPIRISKTDVDFGSIYNQKIVVLNHLKLLKHIWRNYSTTSVFFWWDKRTGNTSVRTALTANPNRGQWKHQGGTAFFSFNMSFLLRKVEDVTTISKPQSLTLVRINDCNLRVPYKTTTLFLSEQ